MFLGLGLGNRNSDQTIQTCWPLLELAFKFFFVLSLATSLLSFFFSPLILYLPNNIPRTIEELQLWRLLSSFLVNGSGLSSILRILFVYYLMFITLPDLERKYSTAWAFIEVLLQIVLSNLVLVTIGYPLLMFDLVGLEHVLGYGAFPLVINFLWQTAAADPNKPTRFCCFPCLIALKWVPWCFTGLTCLLGDTLISNVVYCLLGYYQHSYRKKSLVSVSLAVYRKFDRLMPQFIINNLGYVKVNAVEDALKTVCSKGCCEGETDDFTTNEEIVNERVEVLGRGTVIGGANIKPVKQEDFKAHWTKKEVKETVVSDQIRQRETPQVEMEEPQIGQMGQSQEEESFDFGQTNVVQDTEGAFTLGYELNPPKTCPPSQQSSSSTKLTHHVLVEQEEYPDSAFT